MGDFGKSNDSFETFMHQDQQKFIKFHKLYHQSLFSARVQRNSLTEKTLFNIWILRKPHHS